MDNMNNLLIEAKELLLEYPLSNWFDNKILKKEFTSEELMSSYTDSLEIMSLIKYNQEYCAKMLDSEYELMMEVLS